MYFHYTLGCPALNRGDVAHQSLVVETADGILADPENIIALSVNATQLPYCLTPATATWICVDLQLLYHVTGLQFMNTSLIEFQLAYGTSRENLSVYHTPVS